jgi:hypothetical protein
MCGFWRISDLRPLNWQAVPRMTVIVIGRRIRMFGWPTSMLTMSSRMQSCKTCRLVCMLVAIGRRVRTWAWPITMLTVGTCTLVCMLVVIGRCVRIGGWPTTMLTIGTCMLVCMLPVIGRRVRIWAWPATMLTVTSMLIVASSMLTVASSMLPCGAPILMRMLAVIMWKRSSHVMCTMRSSIMVARLEQRWAYEMVSVWPVFRGVCKRSSSSLRNCGLCLLQSINSKRLRAPSTFYACPVVGFIIVLLM